MQKQFGNCKIYEASQNYNEPPLSQMLDEQ
jgi:hypothetical protein